MSATFDKVIAEIRELPLEEQRQLRDTLDEWLTTTVRPQGKLVDSLIQAGLLAGPETDLLDSEEDDDFPPIEIKGKPISETIIEERR